MTRQMAESKQVSIERYRDQVQITIRCNDTYAAIILYEDIVERGRKDGNVSISLEGTTIAPECI